MPSIDILENETRKKIINEFLRVKDIIDYNDIKKVVEHDTSRPDYHLNLLVENHFIRRIRGRGKYRLNEIMVQPLRELLKIKVPICLIGGLGIEISLYVDVLDALRKVSLIPQKYILLTSPEVKAKFTNLNKELSQKIETILYELDYQTVLRENYAKLKELLDQIVRKEILNFDILCELTGGTKPISIALMELSKEYHLQSIYYSGKKINFLF